MPVSTDYGNVSSSDDLSAGQGQSANPHSAERAGELAARLIEISQLHPQRRGRRFEGFLGEMLKASVSRRSGTSDLSASRSTAASG
jgi:hypothetical protein